MRTATGVLLASLVAVLLAGCGKSVDVPDTEAEGPVFRNWANGATYVGRDTCAQCHQPQFESFVRSQMGRSWKHARRSLSDADWESPPVLRDAFNDLYFQPFAVGEDLFVREFRLEDADTTHQRIEQIDFIVGSGHHTNSHVYERGGYLYQIPVTWYAQDAKWGLAPKFQKSGNNYRFSRVITDECMACHNAPPAFVEGSENRFEQVPSGIGCENCHGPGSIHVEEKKAGIVVNVAEEIDDSIVNPGKLSPERQLDVCKRCHMQGVAVFEDGEKPLDWRPGKVLAAHEQVFWPRQPDSVSTFIMASHPDRLAMSACFESTWDAYEKAGGAKALGGPDGAPLPLTCVTCHDPHVPIEEMPDEHYDTTCQSCHEGPQAVTTPCTEPTVIAGTNTASCASCHMPPSETSDIPYVEVTDHYIRVVEKDVLPPESVEAQRRFIRLAGLIGRESDHHQVADGFLTYYEQFTDRPGMLDSAAARLQMARRQDRFADLTASWIRLWHLKQDYAATVRYVGSDAFSEPADAWTWYRMAQAFRQTGRTDDAVVFMERAVALGEDHLRFTDQLGAIYIEAGRLDDAVAVLTRNIERQSRFIESWINRGFAQLLLGALPAAEADFVQALRLDPNQEQALANLASLYANTNRVDEARPLVRRLLEMSPGNAGYRQLWNALQ